MTKAKTKKECETLKISQTLWIELPKSPNKLELGNSQLCFGSSGVY